MELYGKKSSSKDSQGRSLYEYDRVTTKFNDQTVIGTVIITNDLYHPEFKILVDRGYWQNDLNGPVIIDIDEVNTTSINSGEHGFRFGKSYREFDNYLRQYDYRSKKID